MRSTPVAIVGMAAVFPGAPDLATFWSNVSGGVDATSTVPADRVDPVFFERGSHAADRFYCARGGFIDSGRAFDPAEFGIMPVAAEETEPDQLLALAAATRALADAGMAGGVPDPSRAGIIIGRGGYLTPATARLEQRVRTAQQLVESVRELLPEVGEDRLAEMKRQFQDALGPSRPEASIGLVPNLVASRIANRLDLHGPAFTVDAACASSLVAVAQAVDELDRERCDVVLAGGVHHCHDVTLWSVFSQLGALSPTEQIRPFDRRADGILIGEGTGLLVLKRLADAERDGDRIYAVIQGVGLASDGRAGSVMSPATGGQVLALERAWAEAGLDPTTVGMVEAHGTATPAGDATEVRTLSHVFGREGRPIGLGSVKSMIGHAMPASGAAGLIKTALAVHHGVLPPTLHCEEPLAELDGTRFRPIEELDDWSEPAGRVRRAGVNAFGFGGINAHVVLEAHGAEVTRRRGTNGSGTPVGAINDDATTRVPARPAAAPATRLFLASARSAAELAPALDDEAAVLEGSDLALLGEAGPDMDLEGPVRLAIADPTPRKITLARKVIERGTPWRGRNDLWFTADGLVTGGGGVARIFPGVEPNFDPDVEDVAAHFGIHLDEATFSTELGQQALGIIRVGRLLHRSLDELAVPADAVAGHSLGEWTAMAAAEAISPAEVDEFIAGLVGGNPTLPDLVFLAVGCGADVAREAIGDLRAVSVSHDNCPHQAIVCGSELDVATVQQRLGAQRILCQTLPFRTGFHTPMFAPHVPFFSNKLDGLTVQTPRRPLWSATSAAPFPPDPAGIRELAVRLYTEPVRFRELVEHMYATGIRVFVQPGLGSVTGFVEDTLHDRPHLAIPAAIGKRSGMAQLTRVAAALWAEGADVRLDRLATPAPAAPELPRIAPIRSGGAPLRFDSRLVAGLRPLDRPTPAPAAICGSGAEDARRTVDDRPTVPAGVGGTGPAARLRADFDAVLAATLDAGRDVLAALDAAPSLRSPARTNGGPPPLADRSGPTEERRVLSLDTVPELIDHAFYRQPEGVGTPADRFPVVPMTMMIELMIEAAANVAPAGRIVIGLRNIRALRWLMVDPPTEAVIKAVPDGDDRVKVEIQGFARAVAVLADRYPDPPEPDTSPLEDERPAPHTADQLYDLRWMFHGPHYQGVTALDTIGSNGVSGEITALRSPGSLLDAAGQMLGYWLMYSLPEDRTVLPMRIERLDLYGPHPQPGERLRCTVRFTEITDTDARGDIEMVAGDRMWARMERFSDHRFETTDASFWFMLYSEICAIAEERDEGTWVLTEPWRTAAMRELVMRRYLSGPERAEYEAMTPKAARSWLIGRIAAKDAVRRWLWKRGHGPIWPIEVTLTNDARGRPLVSAPGGRDLRISLAHRPPYAACAVAEGEDTGVDIEVVEERSPEFERLVATDAEKELVAARVAAGEDRDEVLTRLWTVKEAVGKALGTGLQGRPRDLEVVEMEGPWSRIEDHWVRTTREGEFVVSTVTRR